jgi:hypothetical protein
MEGNKILLTEFKDDLRNRVVIEFPNSEQIHLIVQ